MGLFGFGKKKEKTPAAGVNDTFTLSGPANASTAKCIMIAGVRGVTAEITINETDNVTLTHGPLTLTGENAIQTYLDVRGEGAPLKPKKARHLGDQNRWIEVSAQLLDTDTQIDTVSKRMNDILATQEYLVGPLTQADAPVAGSIFTLKKAGKLPSGLDHIDAWLTRVEGLIPDNVRASYMAHVS
ncbi:MAG: hypothetical protein CBC79_03515 [Gammaproteobacteria bacterium TMED119]|nr:MAG: hypothetical protein CBC79_03515 [Gammaproteobacteria bacterium TMED119]RCL44825.1 MAG: hypothetical protein DBW91_05675 [Candidatus Thioglobus sp.]|tara:strand:+ start:544 stop:1098 length:555 start_codon:yes stop_codon:yes gene_type:complete